MGSKNPLFPWEIPLFSIDFWNVQWAISPLVPWRLVAHFVRTGLIFYMSLTALLSLAVFMFLPQKCIWHGKSTKRMEKRPNLSHIFKTCEFWGVTFLNMWMSFFLYFSNFLFCMIWVSLSWYPSALSTDHMSQSGFGWLLLDLEDSNIPKSGFWAVFSLRLLHLSQFEHFYLKLKKWLGQIQNLSDYFLYMLSKTFGPNWQGAGPIVRHIALAGTLILSI